MYLDADEVSTLSQALTRPEIGWWMLDVVGPGLKKMMNKMAGMLANAPFKFAPDNGVAYFEDLGWRCAEVQSLLMAARRFHRLPISMRAAAWLPQPDPCEPGSRWPWSAVALLVQSAELSVDRGADRPCAVNPLPCPQPPCRFRVFQFGVRPLGDDAPGRRTEVASALRPHRPLEVGG
jgi:hypothetical protein